MKENISPQDGDTFLIAAMALEVKPLLSSFRDVSTKNRVLYAGRMQGRGIWLTFSGVGGKKAREAAEWVRTQAPGHVIGIGFAGGLSPALEWGELFMPAVVRNREGKKVECRLFAEAGPAAQGTLLTVDRIVQTQEDKKKLHPLADAVDMESYPIAEIMNEKGIPYSCIRIISDTADDSLPFDFSGFLNEERVKIVEILKLFKQHPFRIFSLLKLGVQSKLLSSRLSDFSLSLLTSLQRNA